MMTAMSKYKFPIALARNTVWMFLGQGLRLIIRALYFVEIARSLGVKNYGAFIGVVALVGIASPFGDLGSGDLLVKNVSRNKSLFATYWGRGLVATVGAGSVLIAIVFLLSAFALPSSIPRQLVLLVAVSDLLGLNLITMCGEAFQALDHLNWTATINVLIGVSRLIGASVLIAIHPHPSPLQWGYVYFYSTASVTITALLLVWSRLGSAKFTGLRWAAEFREGLYFSTSRSAQTIYDDIDKTMLARLGSLEATGIYGAAYKLIDVSFVPVSSLLQASYSSFFRTGAKGITPCFKYAKPLLLWALGYAVVIGSVLLLSAGIVPYILGSGYARSAEALRWLAVLPMFKVMSYFFSNTLTGAGYQGSRACVQVSVALFNVLVNLWIIPLYSWRGAAWSSIASDALLALGTGAAVFLIARREKTSAIEARADAVA
jgi:O-antigen/teichoic acid export membrane protein